MPGTLAPSSCTAVLTNPSESPLKTWELLISPFMYHSQAAIPYPQVPNLYRKQREQMDCINMGNVIHHLKRNKKLHSHLYDNWLGPLPIEMKWHHPSASFSLSLVFPFDLGAITYGRGKHSNKATPPSLPFLLPHPTMTERPSQPGPEKEKELNWWDFSINLLLFTQLS